MSGGDSHPFWAEAVMSQCVSMSLFSRCGNLGGPLVPDNEAMRWKKASTSDFAAKIKLLCWVMHKLRFEAFSNAGYLCIITLNNTILGNRDYCFHLANEHTEGQKRDLAEISRTTVSPLCPTPDPVRCSRPLALSAY